MTTVDFAAFVEKLADVAADVILPFFRTALFAEDKNAGGMFDPVTEADRAAEVAMRHLIQATFPEHGIIGEEFGSVQSEAEYVWVLDPIDGTKSFIAGMPVWGNPIGLLHNGRPAYGMMVQPFTLERFTGDGKGRGLARSWLRSPDDGTQTCHKGLPWARAGHADDDVATLIYREQAYSVPPG